MKTMLRAGAVAAALPLIAVGLIGMVLAIRLDRWLQRPAVPDRARRSGW